MADPAQALASAMAAAAAEIDRALDALIPPPEGDEARLFEAMRYASMGGGKRLRGFLVLEGAAQFGVAREAALRVASAIEMLHAYSLVHDDLPCMDDDDLRRGKPTVHRAFDEATAVLAGDALQTQAFLVLSEPETHSDPAVRAELCRALARAAGARGMCGGQMLDMLAEEAGRAKVSVRDDGVGFDTTLRPTSAYGLVGMRFRVEATGGALTLDSAKGQGTLICVTLPLSELASGEAPGP